MNVRQYHINEFVIDTEIPLPLCEIIDAPPISRYYNNLRVLRASLADIPCVMRKICPQLVYDVGDGFLIDGHGFEAHIGLKGRCITIDCPDKELDNAAEWITHVGLAITTLLQGGLPLHGAGVEIGKRFVALIADSGSGKSTLASFLLQRGARFGNDDLIPTYVNEDKAISYPSMSLDPKLMRSAVDHLGFNVAELIPCGHDRGEDEFKTPTPPDMRCVSPTSLAAVFYLSPQQISDDTIHANHLDRLIAVERLSDEVAAEIIRRDLHGIWTLGRSINSKRIQSLCKSLIKWTPTYKLTYPKAYRMLPALAARITQLVEALP